MTTPDPENSTPQGSPLAEPNPTTPPSTPPDTGATEFRYGDDAPEYLRGKSPQETLAWVNNLVTEVQQLVANKQPAAPAQQQRTMTQDIKLPDPDLALTDPQAYQAQLTGYLNATQLATLSQAAAPVYAQLSTMAKEMSRNDASNKAIWDKWGSEVEQMVAGVPAHMRTKELYDQAVIMVKGRHVDELATEKAATLAAAGTGLARSTADGGADAESGDADVWSKIEATAMGAAALRVAGKKGILAAIRSGAYKDLDDYAAKVAKSTAKVDPSNPNVIRDYVRK